MALDAAPPITEPLLLRRLAMDDDAFFADYCAMAVQVGPRRCSDAAFERALGYPWERPQRGFVIRDGALVASVAEDAESTAGLDRTARVPLLAIGSNGAPGTLLRKFAHLTGADRDVVVECGWLEDVDVVAAAHPTAYGSMPATLACAAGTAVRVAVLWVTPLQFTQLAWTEFSYRLGRLGPVVVEGDDGSETRLDAVWAFVSRFGAFAPGGPAGSPIALAAIPARSRSLTALDQQALLERAAIAAGIGGDAPARALVDLVFADLERFARSPASAAIRACGVPLDDARWQPFPLCQTN